MDTQPLSTLKRQQPLPVSSRLSYRETNAGFCSTQLTQSRLRVYCAVPNHSNYSVLGEQILTGLVAEYGLEVSMTGQGFSSNWGDLRGDLAWFDLEMQGTVTKVQNGLAFLESLTVKLVGKPNPAGDCWYC